jgi:hypothetical protein
MDRLPALLKGRILGSPLPDYQISNRKIAAEPVDVLEVEQQVNNPE